MELSSRGVFASFESLVLEALTDMCLVAHLVLHILPKQVVREGEGASRIKP